MTRGKSRMRQSRLYGSVRGRLATAVPTATSLSASSGLILAMSRMALSRPLSSSSNALRDCQFTSARERLIVKICLRIWYTDLVRHLARTQGDGQFQSQSPLDGCMSGADLNQEFGQSCGTEGFEIGRIQSFRRRFGSRPVRRGGWPL